jgi:ADP-heptose:LPS heptosyltransferase
LAERCWQSESFARIADELAVRGLQIVLTGTRAEVSVVQAVAEAMRFPVLNLVGRTSLGALAILLKGARLVICNDTGISHLADALQTKSVVIFSNSDPVRWAPLNRQLHRIVCTSSSERSRVNSTSTSSVITQVLAEAINLLEQDFAYVS